MPVSLSPFAEAQPVAIAVRAMAVMNFRAGRRGIESLTLRTYYHLMAAIER